MQGLDTCELLWDEIGLFEETLGPDADATDGEGESLVNSGLQAGGELLGGFIPFRGLVRHISGAEARESRWEEAIYAGVARRSFLKGVALGRDCPTPEEAAIEAAHDVLGLGRNETGATEAN